MSKKIKIGGVTINHHNDYLGKHIENNNEFYEVDYLKLSMKIKRPGIIIDVGANIGNHSLYWGKKGNQVIAIEPHPDNFTILKKNIKDNKMDGLVKPLELAVSNCNSIYSLNISDPENMGSVKTVMGSGESNSTVLIDDILYGSNTPVGLIKVDVEGMELEVLSGAFITIQRFLPDIIVECNSKKTKRYMKYLGYVKIYQRDKSKTIYYKHNTHV